MRHQILAAKKEGKPPPELPKPDVSNGHVLAIHRLHAADAEDAWLQREWGEILVAQGNLQQAATHFEVSQLLLNSGHFVAIPSKVQLMFQQSDP